MADNDDPRCFCEIIEICGHRLKDGVKIVLIATIAIALAFLLTGIILSNNLSWENANNDPTRASLLVFSLVAIAMSPYQILLSLLLLWQVLQAEGNIFICSVWHVSHINIMVVYFILFAATSVTFYLNGHIVSSFLTGLFLILYEVMFMYYCGIINRYLHSQPQEDRYL